MDDASRPAADAAGTATPGAVSSRLVSIDILRGLAILWVISFHLWIDDTRHLLDSPALFGDLLDRVVDGRAIAALTALAEVVLGLGYLGVPVFMMLSGLSLTLNAYRRAERAPARATLRRFRRVVPVYLTGLVLVLATIAVIAYLQTRIDGGGFLAQWAKVRVGGKETNIERPDVIWAFTVGGWVYREPAAQPPVGSLWFVQLLLQYYLIFPFALMLLRRAGPLRFALVAASVTIIARAIYIPVTDASLDPYRAGGYLSMLAPFRGTEFFFGMIAGWLLARRRDEVGAWFASGLDVAGVVVLGVLLVMSSVILDAGGEAQRIFSDVCLNAGLVLVVAPLLFKAPGRLEASALARALVFLGVVSFTALIVNDVMRYTAEFMRWEGVDGFVWWFFLIVVYVPVGTLIAYPLAALFGLLPSQRGKPRVRRRLAPALAPVPAAVAPVRTVHAAPARRPNRRERREAAHQAALARGAAVED